MASSVTLEGLLSRPNRIVAASLVLLSMLAWVGLFGRDAGVFFSLPHMHAGFNHMHGAPHVWDPYDRGAALLMWLLMAVAMMLPTAVPAILSFADIARAGHRNLPAASRIAAFVLGYLATWWGFGVLATGVQWGLSSTAPRVFGLDSGRPVFGAAVLFGAGLYQLSALKEACLTQCRSPMMFFLAHWRDGRSGAAVLGLRHGLHCVGCCWALMVLMLLSGTMSIPWTAALSAVMLLEKIVPAGRVVSRAVGIALIICGGLLLAFPTFRGGLP